MAPNAPALPPLMWFNGNPRNNLVVLTSRMLYLASVSRSDLPRIDLGLEDGQPADELLPAKAWKIPLDTIERIQFKHVPVVVHQLMNRDVAVQYRESGRTRTLAIQLENQAMRDEFVNNLNARVGPWPIAEANESPWLILANYLYIIFVIVLLAMLFSWLGLAFPMRDDGSLVKRYWDFAGPWGIAAPAMAVCVAVLVAGIRQLRTPPLIVTYQPEA